MSGLRFKELFMNLHEKKKKKLSSVKRIQFPIITRATKYNDTNIPLIERGPSKAMMP